MRLRDGLVALACAAGCGEATTAMDDGVVGFGRDVMPVLERHCVRCHSWDVQGDFRTADTAYSYFTGPQPFLADGCDGIPSEVIVVPGDPGASLLWDVVGRGFAPGGTCPGPLGMPKNDPRGILVDFDPAGAEAIRLWIEQGATPD